MASPSRVSRDTRFEIVNERGKLVVNGSTHVFVVDTPDRGIWEIGVSRAGMRAVLKLAREQLGLWPSRSDVAVLEAGVVGCVARSASPHVLPRVFDQVAETSATPLVYSRPFLAQKYLASDVERFRPCRVAVALIESDDNEDATPEHVDTLVARLERWRDLYAASGQAGHAVNATLTDHGDAASVDALWGLRKVALSRRVPTLDHVEVLGALGAHRRIARLSGHIRVVEEAAQAELQEALANTRQTALGVPKDATPAHALAELLAIVDGDLSDLRFRDLYDAAIKQLRTRLPLSTPTARAPIPLPVEPGVILLACVGDVINEGRKMAHCVGASRFAAAAGEAFVFRVEQPSGNATVQLDRDGRVVEAKGPKNDVTFVSRWGARVLARWGRGFWAARLGMKQRTWARGRPDLHGDGHGYGAGASPLTTVDACYAAYARICVAVPDDDGALAAWFEDYGARAIRGEVGLVRVASVAGGVLEVPDVLALTETGQVVARTSDVLAKRG